jgi:predicted AlkP superfamily pyrophosphatase or phosphodiesterase
MIDVDGMRRDTFQQACQDGRLPNFQRVFARALWFDNASSVLPTVTMAAQASLFTGTPPARHGVPGNQWFDRSAGRLIDYMSPGGLICVYAVTVLGGAQCSGGLGNGHLLAPTIYEAAAQAGLTSAVYFSQYWKGAARAAPPTLAEMVSFLAGSPIDWNAFDSEMAGRAIADLKSNGLPSLVTLYFAGTDGIGHQDGIAGQVPYLSGTVDPLLGQVLDAFESLDPSWRENTMFVLVSDHGRTDLVPYTEDLVLQADLQSALPTGATIAENGGMAYIYLDQPDLVDLPSLAAALLRDPRLSPTVASVRVRGAGDSPRDGDLILALQPVHYFPSPTSIGSNHGSVYSADLNVPLLVAMPGGAAGHRADPVSITQVAGTIAEYLGFPMDSADAPLPVRPGTRGRGQAGYPPLPRVGARGVGAAAGLPPPALRQAGRSRNGDKQLQRYWNYVVLWGRILAGGVACPESSSFSFPSFF